MLAYIPSNWKLISQSLRCRAAATGWHAKGVLHHHSTTCSSVPPDCVQRPRVPLFTHFKISALVGGLSVYFTQSYTYSFFKMVKGVSATKFSIRELTKHRWTNFEAFNQNVGVIIFFIRNQSFQVVGIRWIWFRRNPFISNVCCRRRTRQLWRRFAQLHWSHTIKEWHSRIIYLWFVSNARYGSGGHMRRKCL